MQDIAAQIPPELGHVDDVLTLYGAWATGRRGPRRCASAEGRYRPEEAQRTGHGAAASPLLTRSELMDAQRALAAVPARLRDALVLLYIPRRTPLPVLLRKHGLSPAACRERHEAGLRQFAVAYAHFRAVSARGVAPACMTQRPPL